MSILKRTKPVKSVIAFFSNEKELLNKTQSILEKKFGKTDYRSDDFDFDETDYYKNEMGEKLLMRFVSFKKQVKRNVLPDIKIFCIKLEKIFSKQNGNNGKRKVNIDPGLLSMENFILSTGKPYSHRIYLDKGVWADLTLIYTKDGFKELPWTYPNYKSEKIIKTLTEIRNIYHTQLKENFI